MKAIKIILASIFMLFTSFGNAQTEFHHNNLDHWLVMIESTTFDDIKEAMTHIGYTLETEKTSGMRDVLVFVNSRKDKFTYVYENKELIKMGSPVFISIKPVMQVNLENRGFTVTKENKKMITWEKPNQPYKFIFTEIEDFYSNLDVEIDTVPDSSENNVSTLTIEPHEEITEKEYYENGQLLYTGNTIDGKQTGQWITYHENGKLMTIENYIDGQRNGVYKTYYENGELQIYGNLIKGEFTGEAISYYPNGKLAAVSNFLDGKQNGTMKSYHSNGELMSVGDYINGNQTGEWKFFYENGKLQAIGPFSEGIEHGQWKYYHENGKLMSIGLVEYGIKVGEWKSYDESGNLINDSNSIDKNDDAENNDANDLNDILSQIAVSMASEKNKNSFVIDNIEYTISNTTDFANFLNKNCYAALHWRDKDNYRFEVIGKTDFSKKSVEFTVKDDKLYLKANIPLNGNCDYGLKEFPVIDDDNSKTHETEQTKYYYLTMKFDYECNGITYKYLTVYIDDKTLLSFEKVKELFALYGKG